MTNNPCVIGSRVLLAKTCSKCGVLHQAAAFQRTIRGYWQTWCKPCQATNTNGRGYLVLLNQKTMRTADNRYKYWSQVELDELERLIFTEKLTHREIAFRLKRTLAGVNQAVFKYVGVPPEVVTEESH